MSKHCISNTPLFSLYQGKKKCVCMAHVCLSIPLSPKARTISSTNHKKLFWDGVGVWSAAGCMHESLRGYVCVHESVSCIISSLGIAMHYAVGWCIVSKGFEMFICARVYRYQPMVCITFVMWTQWYVMSIDPYMSQNGSGLVTF